MKELWVEKYRPNTVDGYVFVDQAQREQVEAWITHHHQHQSRYNHAINPGEFDLGGVGG